MRIGVMLRALDEKGGIGVYTHGILEELLERDRENEYVLFYRNPANLGRYAELPNVRERLVSAPHKTLWDQVAIPLAAFGQAKIVVGQNVPVALWTRYTVEFSTMLVRSSRSLTSTRNVAFTPTPVAPDGTLVPTTVGGMRSMPGAVVNVTIPVVVSTDQPEVCSTVFSATTVVPATGFLPVEGGRAHPSRRVELAPRLADLRLEDLGVDAGDELSLLDGRVEVDEELADLPRDLRADLDGGDGIQVARGRHRRRDGPDLDSCGAVLGGLAAALRVEVGGDPAGHQKNEEPEPNETSHR